MEKSFFDKKIVKNRIVLYPYDKDSTISLEETETTCEVCGEFFGINPLVFHSEEFVWHPDHEY